VLNKHILIGPRFFFLGAQGYDLVAPEDEVVKQMLALASGQLDEESLTEWIASRTEPRRK